MRATWLLICTLCASAAAAQEELEPVVITSTRLPAPASEAPSRVDVLQKESLRSAKALDEALRTAPEVGLFRRNSSLVADPSAQGVNLRGIGPSGVSRALVLQDGIPVNDGFGGWVYWAALPRLSLERIEIAPGGASGQYGSSALGGVVQLVSRPIADGIEAELQGGSFTTGSGAVFAASHGIAFEGEALDTGGYAVVAPGARGAVDRDAWSRHVNARIRGEGRLGGVHLFGRVGGFTEDENGGTRFTTAQARGGEAALGADVGFVQLRAFARLARFAQERARIPSDRSTEQLASSQSAPADDEGASLLWRAPHGLTFGADARRTFGRSNEQLFTGTIATRDSSGEQRTLGVFAQEAATFGNVHVLAAARLDTWHNLGGVRRQVLTGGGEQDTDLADRSDTQLDPRLAVRWSPYELLSLRAAAYRSFRAPTLNELYRPFQVGQVRTDANPQLGPESLRGAEAGIDLGPISATFYWSTLDHPITNVTVGPNLQMRQNLGAARIRGLDLGAAWSRGPVRLEAGYSFVDAVVEETGRALPQDPRHRLRGAARLELPRIATVSVQVRWLSDQFEDDQNLLRLPGFAVVDVSAERQLAPRWSAFVAGENLLDRQYLVGLQGVPTVGQPMCLRAGVRYSTF